MREGRQRTRTGDGFGSGRGAGLFCADACGAEWNRPCAAGRSQVRERFLTNRFPEKPSLAPAFSIPIEPLGFAAPGAIYLGARNALVSLDFLDEDRLLFTFRVPGLIHRDPKSGGEERRAPDSRRGAQAAAGHGGGRGVYGRCTTACATCGRSGTAIFWCATATICSKATPR